MTELGKMSETLLLSHWALNSSQKGAWCILDALLVPDLVNCFCLKDYALCAINSLHDLVRVSRLRTLLVTYTKNVLQQRISASGVGASGVPA